MSHAAKRPRIAPDGAQPVGSSDEALDLAGDLQPSTIHARVAHGILWSGLERWGGQLAAFVVFFVLARLLDPEAFGLVALGSVFVALVDVFVDQGLAEAIVQRRDLKATHLDTAFWINLGAGVLLTLLGVAGAGFVATALGEPRLAPVVIVLSISFLTGALRAVPHAVLRRRLAFQQMATCSITAVVTGGGVGVYLAIEGFGVWSLVWQQVITRGVETAGYWIASDWRPGFHVSVRPVREMMGFGMSIMGVKSLQFLEHRSQDLVIGVMLGPVALGIFNIAFRVVRILEFLLAGTIHSVIFPVFARFQQDQPRICRGFYAATEMTSLVAFPIFLGIAVLAPELVTTLFGDQWAGSARVLRLLALGGMVRVMLVPNDSILRAVGKPKWELATKLVNGVVNLVLVLLTAHLGVVAVALAVTVRTYFFAPLSLWVLCRALPFSPQTLIRRWLPQAAAVGVLVIVVIATKVVLPGSMNHVLRLLTLTAAGALAYLGTVAAVSPQLGRRAVHLAVLATTQAGDR